MLNDINDLICSVFFKQMNINAKGHFKKRINKSLKGTISHFHWLIKFLILMCVNISCFQTGRVVGEDGMHAHMEDKRKTEKSLLAKGCHINK